MPDRPNERGAALLTVLLLVAVMAVVTAVALERLTLATRMAQNGVAADQGRAIMMAGEAVAAQRLGDLVAARPERISVAGGWLGTAQEVPVPGGTVTARVRDADNCFNVNGLVQGTETLVANAAGIAQFSALLRLLGVEARVADQIAVSAADWIDSDAVPGAGGAEDEYYLQFPEPYRTASSLLADPSELRVVNGMTPEIYARARPWLCALPVAELSSINVNTLLPDQGILLAMLVDGRLSPGAARQLLARRPPDGYGSLDSFWGQPELAALGGARGDGQATLASRWFEVDFRVTLGASDISGTSLFDAKRAPARLIRRRWGDDG